MPKENGPFFVVLIGNINTCHAAGIGDLTIPDTTVDQDWANVFVFDFAHGTLQSQVCPACNGTAYLCCEDGPYTVYRCKCDAGYKSSHAERSREQCTCQACPAGTYSLDGNTTTSCTTCSVGKYSGEAASKCETCPPSGDVTGTTQSTGSTSITQCYLPTGSGFSDSTGNGTYTEDCYY